MKARALLEGAVAQGSPSVHQRARFFLRVMAPTTPEDEAARQISAALSLGIATNSVKPPDGSGEARARRDPRPARRDPQSRRQRRPGRALRLTWRGLTSRRTANKPAGVVRSSWPWCRSPVNRQRVRGPDRGGWRRGQGLELSGKSVPAAPRSAQCAVDPRPSIRSLYPKVAPLLKAAGCSPARQGMAKSVGRYVGSSSQAAADGDAAEVEVFSDGRSIAPAGPLRRRPLMAATRSRHRQQQSALRDGGQTPHSGGAQRVGADLGADVPIESIAVYSGPTGSSAALLGFSLRSSTDGATWPGGRMGLPRRRRPPMTSAAGTGRRHP